MMRHLGALLDLKPHVAFVEEARPWGCS